MEAKDFTVTIEFRDKDLKKVGERSYTFNEYSELLKMELFRVIMDVEDMLYCKFGSKQEWDSDVDASFQKIRHKLLDLANSVERLPSKLRYKGVSCASVNLSEVLAQMFRGSNV